jgi:hypothetical protein
MRYYGANATRHLTGISYVSAFNGDDHAQTYQRPHARPAIATLERLHMELGGKLLDNRQMAQELAEQMLHIEACIKMLDPTYNLAPYHGEASEGQRLVQARHSI